MEPVLPTPAADDAVGLVSKMRVLVVEPDLLSARVLRTKLENWNFTVHIEAEGRAALEWLSAERYRIVMLNLDESKVGGIELCRTIRALPYPAHIYIIGCCTNNDKRVLVSALDAGADDFIMKPFYMPEVRMRMNRARQMLDHDDALFSGGGTCPTTGLINRGAFEQFLRVILAQAKRTGVCGALIFVRMENLQDVFRRHGYQAMHDLVLDLSARLRTVHRTSDLLAKTREDEFCMLLQNTHWDLCRPVVERIDEIGREVVIEVRGHEIRPRLAVSIVNFPGEQDTAEALLEGAGAIRYGGDDAPQPPSDQPVVIV